MTVRVTRGLTAGTAFGDNLRAQINGQIELDAQRVGIEAVRRVNEMIVAEFNNARPPGRRRPNMGRKINGSFTSSVEVTSGPYPVIISLISNADARKVGILNNGSAPHRIGRDGQKLSWPTEVGWRTVIGPVDHPGTRPHFFMERAVEQAVAAIYHKRISIRRSPNA